MNARQCRTFFERLQAHNPSPSTELNYRSPFELLIAVVLSAQATDTRVNKVTEVLFAMANTPQAILKLGQSQLEHYISSIGLYRNKASHIITLCQLLVQHHGGEVPNDRQALQALPGVGRKTANVILNTIFGHATIAVDTHIFRVANRTGLAPGKTVWLVEQQLLRVVPESFKQHAHHWLVLHGRYTCRARQPHCAHCVVHDLCEYAEKTASVLRRE